MKKFNSLENLKSLLPDDYKSVDKINSSKKTPLNKQFLEAHYSVKGRAGTPVIIIKGFSLMDKNEIKLISKEIKNKLTGFRIVCQKVIFFFAVYFHWITAVRVTVSLQI